MNGSPGTNDPLPPVLPPVRVNEALTHSDPESDWIELYNPTATNVNIGGWFLTDDFYTPEKYRIANGTTISPGGYLVFTGTSSFELGANGFKLSEYGEQVYLFSGNATTNLTGYYQGFDFGAAPNGVSFGRYVNSQTNVFFVLQSTNTPGTNNAPPRVGPSSFPRSCIIRRISAAPMTFWTSSSSCTTSPRRTCRCTVPSPTKSGTAWRR